MIRKPIPRLLLISDARNDAALERVLARMPRGSGLVFRHYHLAGKARRARYAQLREVCRRQGHSIILSGCARQARAWCADGAYGGATRLGPPAGGMRLVTAHSLRDLRHAGQAHADAVLLSPVFATRSHPGAVPLRAVRFNLLARQSPVPVIALGGVTPGRAARLKCYGWAAIDGLT